MNFMISNFIILLSLFIPIIQSCGNFDCPPVSNHAFVVYTIEPNLSFTYNNVDNLRRERQHSTRKGLRDGLVLMAGGVFHELAALHGARPEHAGVGVEIVDSRSDFLNLNVTFINDECLYDCNYEQTYAAAGTYFMRNGKLRRRLVDGICLNGEIVQEKSERVVVKLVYDISVKIVGGRTFCETHWRGLADGIQGRMERDQRGHFVGKSVIEKAN